jgi:hypothetical protein
MIVPDPRSTTRGGQRMEPSRKKKPPTFPRVAKVVSFRRRKKISVNAAGAPPHAMMI